MKSIPILSVAAACVAAACGEYRGGYRTTVAASVERSWEVCLPTLERNFGPVVLDREKDIDLRLRIPLAHPEHTQIETNPVHRKAIVYRPWPDGSTHGTAGDRIELEGAEQGEGCTLWITSNHPKNAAAVMRTIFAELEANGIGFERIGFGEVGGD